MVTVMPNGSQQRDLERGEMLVAEFTDRFGDAHLALAEHAALPLVLTPELVNYIHGEFLRRELPHYEATADLLLSELCREIGYEQYAMDRDARAWLLARMREHGDEAVQAVAGKLLGYVGYLARTRRAYERQELKNQQWAAMVYLDDARNAAIEELVERINHCLLAGESSGGVTSRAELARLSRLVEDFAPQLQQYPEFVERAQLIGRLLADASGAVAADAARDQKFAQRITVAGVEMAGLRSLLRLHEKSVDEQVEEILHNAIPEGASGPYDEITAAAFSQYLVDDLIRLAERFDQQRRLDEAERAYQLTIQHLPEVEGGWLAYVAWLKRQTSPLAGAKFLVEGLGHGSILARTHAVRALASLGSIIGVEEVAALIRSLRDDESTSVRQVAAEALAGFQSGETVEALSQAARNDPDEGVRRSAAESLRKMGVDELQAGVRQPLAYYRYLTDGDLIERYQRQQRELLAQVWHITDMQREINALGTQSGDEWERLSRELIEATRVRVALGETIGNVFTVLQSRQITPPATVESLLIQTVMTDPERFGERRDDVWQSVRQYLSARDDSDDNLGEGLALSALAWIFSSIEEFNTAIAFYQFALEKVGGPQWQYDILHGLAMCHEQLSDRARAEECHLKSLELAKAANSPAKQINAHRALGDIYQRTERFDDALQHLNRALELAGDFEDDSEQVSILMQIASIHEQKGDHQNQVATLRSVLEIAPVLEDRDEEARVRIRLGEALLDMQEYRKAIEQYGLASEISQDDDTLLPAYSGLAHAQFRQGHWGEADTFFSRALQLAEARGDEGWIATTLEMLGLTRLEMTDYPTSLDYYERALRLHQQRRDRPQLAATLAQMGRVHEATGDAQNAFDCFRQAALLFAELGQRSDEAAMGEACARASESLGQRDDAIEFAEGALALYEQIDLESAGRVRAFLDRLRTTPPAVASPASHEAARKIADPDQRAMALRDAALQLADAGEIAESKRVFDEALAAAKQIKGWIRRLAAQRQINAARNQSGVDKPQSFASTFSFETVTLDETGREVDRRRLTASQFIEDLGNGVTLEMVSIPGGAFLMGAPASEEGSSDRERPRQEVTVPPFLIGKFTITQRQWRAIAEDKSLKAKRNLNPEPSYFRGDDRPVEQISWHDAREFCARLSKKTGRPYRLPAEAEWEMACRAGTTTPFAFGETITPVIVNYNGNYPYAKAAKGAYREETIPVGSLGVANAFGLYDMHGNVWEWCEDVWHSNYQGVSSDGSAWLSDGDSSFRLLRGGSWGNQSIICRSAFRNYYSLDYRNHLIGVRVVVARVF